FPLDALPRAARDHCAEVAAATGTDPAFTALPCLAALAGCIGNTRRLQIKRAWPEPAVVWAVTVAESGSVKSPPAELAVKAASEVPHWLSFHGGRPVRVNRKTGDRKFLYAPRTALSVTGTIQPGTLKRSLTPEFFSCGLAARLLFAMPPRRKKEWSDDDLD